MVSGWFLEEEDSKMLFCAAFILCNRLAAQS
jgi:hypothetical protein